MLQNPAPMEYAKVAQEMVVKEVQERQAQESQDRRLAEKLALEEAGGNNYWVINESVLPLKIRQSFKS